MPLPPPSHAAALALVLVLTGCAHTPRIPGPLRPLGRAPPAPLARSEPGIVRPAPLLESEAPDRFGTSLADAAEHYLEVAPESWRGDCSSFVCAAAGRAGWPLSGNTRSLWEMAESVGAVHHRKIPLVGDLVFFDDTYDRNGNGRPDDDLTHVAVVLEVDRDGTILMAHAGTSAGRTTLRMNLLEPDVQTDENGRELNGWLRRPRSSDKPGTPHLASECWRGFATLEPQPIVD